MAGPSTHAVSGTQATWWPPEEVVLKVDNRWRRQKCWRLVVGNGDEIKSAEETSWRTLSQDAGCHPIEANFGPENERPHRVKQPPIHSRQICVVNVWLLKEDTGMIKRLWSLSLCRTGYRQQTAMLVETSQPMRHRRPTVDGNTQFCHWTRNTWIH